MEGEETVEEAETGEEGEERRECRQVGGSTENDTRGPRRPKDNALSTNLRTLCNRSQRYCEEEKKKRNANKHRIGNKKKTKNEKARPSEQCKSLT